MDSKDTCDTSTSKPQRCRKHHGKHHGKQFTEHQHLDQRAVYGNTSVKYEDDLYNFLVEYNKEREEIEFRKIHHTCDVCLTDKAGVDCVRLACGHFFCKTCVSECYKTHITEGNMDMVKCLAVKCPGPGLPTSAQVHELVGQELFERYDQILLQRALESMTDLTYCPRQQCNKPVILEPDEKLAVCSHCLYRFCSICKMCYHGVEPCRFKSEQREKVFQEYSNASHEEKLALEKQYGKKQLSMLVEMMQSESYIKKSSKPCPNCSIPIEKFEGCNKVACTKCGTYFCWVCSQHLSHNNPYFHFQDRASPCFEQLFEDVGRQAGVPDDSDFEDSDEEWTD